MQIELDQQRHKGKKLAGTCVYIYIYILYISYVYIYNTCICRCIIYVSCREYQRSLMNSHAWPPWPHGPGLESLKDNLVASLLLVVRPGAPSSLRRNQVPWTRFLQLLGLVSFVAAPWGHGLDTHRVWEAHWRQRAIVTRCIKGITTSSY